MIKPILSLIFVFVFCFIFPQNNSFIYELKFKPSLVKDSIAKETFSLDVKDGKLVFRTLKEKAFDSTAQVSKINSFMTTSFKDNKSVCKDLKLKETTKLITNFQKVFTIKIDESLKWEIKGETKEILGMKTQKAITNYGGRNWVAWFTTEISLPEGPYVFHGLPGLICEITDSKNEYSFSLVQIRKLDGTLYEKQNGFPITWKQYEKLAKDYYSDPTREINGKISGSTAKIRWIDEQGNDMLPNFKEMNEREQGEIRENNNPIEINHPISYP